MVVARIRVTDLRTVDAHILDAVVRRAVDPVDLRPVDPGAERRAPDVARGDARADERVDEARGTEHLALARAPGGTAARVEVGADQRRPAPLPGDARDRVDLVALVVLLV